MNLVIDIGNSKVKVAVFELDTIITTAVFDEIYFLDEVKRISNQYAIERSIVSSVKDINEEYLEELQKLPFLITLNSDTQLPFKNLYATPSTLGNDRIALAAAAASIYPSQKFIGD